MERHPAGWDTATFRSLPSPRRVPSSRATPSSYTTGPSSRWDSRDTQHRPLLNAQGIHSALCALEAVAGDVLQPVTPYNRVTYLDRFNTAALQLADAFISHVNQIRRQEIREHQSRVVRAQRALPRVTTGLTDRGNFGDEEDDDHVFEERIRRKRLLRKRPRPRYASSDDEEYVGEHRRVLPRRSKEARGNLSDDLAYSFMVKKAAAAEEKKKALEQSRRLHALEVFDSSDEETDEDGDLTDEASLNRVLRPMPFVARRPLASDNRSRTPFIQEDDDSTDTEQRRKEQARRSLKTVIYGPVKAEFTEKELLAVFPARSKRRMRCDGLVRISESPPESDANTPGRTFWTPPVVPLCNIPKDMISRYIHGTYWLSPRPEDASEADVNILPNASEDNAMFAKQRLPSSDRETRDGDSGKASTVTNEQSGSSTTGSPRAKKLDMQNGKIGPELGPSVAAMQNGQREEQKRQKDSDGMRRTNGKTCPPRQSLSRPWKDLAPYGLTPKVDPPIQQACEHKGSDLSSTPLPTVVLDHAKHQTAKKIHREEPMKQSTASNLTPLQKKNIEAQTLRQLPTQSAQPRNVAQESSGRVLQGVVKPSPSQPTSRPASRKAESSLSAPLPQPSQVPVKPSSQQISQEQKDSPTKSSPETKSSPVSSEMSSENLSNQMVVVARGSPMMQNVGMHHAQIGAQPQLGLQAQPTIFATVPVHFQAHQTGFAGQPAFQLQQYGQQDPRMLAQWQLQNAALQQEHGTLQLSPGLISVNGVMTGAPNGPFSLQNRFAPVGTGIPAATNTALPAEPTVRADVVALRANDVSVSATAQPTEHIAASLTPSPSQGRPAVLTNGQLQEQYQKHYEEMYSRHYQQHMKSLKKDTA